MSSGTAEPPRLFLRETAAQYAVPPGRFLP